MIIIGVIKENWFHETPVYVSEEMEQLIKSSKMFSLPPIGPVGDHIRKLNKSSAV